MIFLSSNTDHSASCKTYPNERLYEKGQARGKWGEGELLWWLSVMWSQENFTTLNITSKLWVIAKSYPMSGFNTELPIDYYPHSGQPRDPCCPWRGTLASGHMPSCQGPRFQSLVWGLKISHKPCDLAERNNNGKLTKEECFVGYAAPYAALHKVPPDVHMMV